MMNFDALKQASRAVSQRDSRRNESFEELLAQARASLEAFGQSPDKARLQILLEQILTAIRLRRTAPEPYVMLAYLHWGCGQFREASGYLRTAQCLSPRLPAVLKMRQLLEEGPRGEPRPIQDSTEDESVSGSFQDGLRQQVPRLLQALDACLPLAETEELTEYENLLSQGRDLLAELNALADLLPEHEQHWLQQLGTFKRRLDAAADRVQALRELVGVTKAIQDIFDVIDAPDRPSASLLEEMFDRCDRLADTLDRLEQEDLDISRVSEFYQELVDELQSLAD